MTEPNPWASVGWREEPIPLSASPCCGARIHLSRGDGVVLGACAKCYRTVVRINAVTGKQEVPRMKHGDNLWPDNFKDGKIVHYRDDPRLELLMSPSTGDFMWRLPDNPPIEEQMAWMDRHKDAILDPAAVRLRHFPQP